MTLLAILFSLIVTSLFALFAVRVFKDTREDKSTH
jgi:hypothetical protein